MKAVLYYHRTQEDFLRVFNMVKDLAIIIENDITTEDAREDSDHIYIIEKNVIYKFNRFNIQFISKVEEAIATSPYPQYEGPLTIINIDDRFTNKKYYTITKVIRYEHFKVNKDAIIDDLYNSLNNNTNNTNKRVRQGFDIL